MLCKIDFVRTCPFLNRQFPQDVAERLRYIIETEAKSGLMKSAEVEAFMYAAHLDAVIVDDEMLTLAEKFTSG